MDFQEFKKFVTKAKLENPVWFGMEPDQAPSEIDIKEAEKKLGKELPQDYKDFLCEYGGGYFVFSNVYSLEERSAWNLIDINNEYSNIREEYILISENGVGDHYGFISLNGVCAPQIYFFDHETEQWNSTQYSNIFEYLKKALISD